MMMTLTIAAAIALASPALCAQAPAETPRPTGESAAVRPAEQFAALPFLSAPLLSPDGSRFAAKVAIDGKQVLAILPLFNDGSKRALVGVGENDLNWWRWVNDNWLVVGIGAVQKVFADDWYISRMAGVSSDGQIFKSIAYKDSGQDAGDLLWVADDGSPRILLSRQKSVYPDEPGFWPEVLEADVSTGKTKQIVPNRMNILNWYADATGTVRMGVGHLPDKQQSWLIYRGNAKDSFRTIDRASGRKDERLIAPELFMDGEKAVVRDSDGGFDAIYDFDLKTMTRGQKLFSVPGYDLDAIVANAAGNGLAGIRYTDTRARVNWVDPAIAKVQADLDKAVGADRTASIVSLSRDQTKMMVLVAGPDRPGSYYFYDTAFGKMNFIANLNADMKNARLNPVRTVRYAARDGLEIAAIMTLPAGREARKLPIIVLPHGGPSARDEESWDWWSQFLAERGYAVIQPNYRGSTGFGSAFADKGDGEWGLKMQDDLNDAVAFLAREGIGDPARACVVGGSYGGYAALRAAQRDGKLYRCAVSFAGVSNLRHLAIADSKSLFGSSSRRWLRSQAPDFAAVSPINFPEQFATPVLLIHGAKDLRVPVAQSRDMAAKLKRAGKTVRYVEQPLGDHHFSRKDDRLQFLQELEAFLAQYNPA
jgi:dipeptidyl aminopeptidase/acylaminoacyl peptidase